MQSEDLPHSSGINTQIPVEFEHELSRKTCPTNRGLRQVTTIKVRYYIMSEDLPHLILMAFQTALL